MQVLLSCHMAYHAIELDEPADNGRQVDPHNVVRLLDVAPNERLLLA